MSRFLLTDDEILTIWSEVANGRGKHGGFLKAFAAAVVYADPMNLQLLRPAAEDLISKYNLAGYLQAEVSR